MMTMNEIEQHFNDSSYWDGSGHGYAGTGYQDFQGNEYKVKRILKAGCKRVLDVGCASGYLVSRLREKGIDAYGVDISKYILGKASAEVNKYLGYATAWDLPFDSNSFDYIVSSGMMEHIPDTCISQTLNEFKRVAPRGILGITLSTDPHASDDRSHINLKSYSWWKNMMLEGYEVQSDDSMVWLGLTSSNIAVVAPTIYPLNVDGYGGIERLVSLFLRGLHQIVPNMEITCLCTDGSRVPRGVNMLSTGLPLIDYAEPNILPAFINLPLQTIFLNFSHSKCASHLNPYICHISPIWHDPFIMKPPQPIYNVAALSDWQAERFRQVYKQDCRVVDPICADSDYFSPGQVTDDYLLFIGKLHPSKGCLQAITACRSLGQKLHIIGPVTPGDPPNYVQTVLSLCDGINIVYDGEVSEEKKRVLIQGAKALLYPVSYPEGQGESHSHKAVEVMVAGCPVILYDQGAMREIVDEGVTGFVIRGEKDLEEAIRRCETISRDKCREKAIERWDYRNVVRRWLPIIEDVSKGDKW